MKHVVMFSSGAGSWAAARRLVDGLGSSRDVHLVFSDTKGALENPHAGEDEDNYRFLKEAAADVLGEGTAERLHWLREGRDVWGVFRDERMIGNTRLSTCSRALKQRPARKFLEEHFDPDGTTVYIGIDWTEEHRVAPISRSYLPYVVRAPLCEPPYLDREQIFADLEKRGIKRPRLYDLGFAHANCGGFCVRQGQGGFLNLLEKMPERYAYHERNEEEMRRYLGKDVAILRDRRGGVTKPLTLKALRERAQAGGQIDRDDIGGCGCFTDTEGAA